MNRKPFFSVVIPYYNSESTIGPLLSSLAQSRRAPAFEVLVVDDGSEKKLEASDIPLKKQELKKLHLQILSLSRNKGPAVARNRGVAVAQAEHIVFLDSDVRVYPDTLFVLWNYYTKDPDIHAITGVWSKEQKTKDFFPNFKALRDWSYWINERDSGHYYYLFSTRIASMKRDVFMRLGGFNPLFRQMEDVEMTYKIVTRYAVIFAPDVRVHHEFEDFWTIAKKYYLRAYYWAILFQERKKFDPVATTWKEAISALTGAGIVGLFCCFLISFFIPWVAVRLIITYFLGFLLVVHLCFVRKFLRFVWKEKGTEFAIQSFFVGIALYCFITAGAVWSRINRLSGTQLRKV